MRKKTRYGLVMTISGGIINGGLAILKLFIGIVSNSVTIFFDAINNFLDVFGNGVGAVGIALKDKKPTDRFPNGFGRCEYLIAFSLSIMTIIMGMLFIFYSLERVIYPLPVYFNWLYFGLLALTVLIKVGMGIAYNRVYKVDNSDITRSLSTDSFMDACITGSTVLCYGLTIVADTNIDAIFGIVIGIFVMIVAIKMVKDSIVSIIGYNNLDASKIKAKLLEMNIFYTIDNVIISDFGKDRVDVFVDGEIDESKQDKLSEFADMIEATIYVVRGKYEQE